MQRESNHSCTGHTVLRYMYLILSEYLKGRLGINYFEKVINYVQTTLEIVQLNYNYMAFEQSN